MSETMFRPITGFPDYRVGDDGSVWSRRDRECLGYGGGTRSVIGPWRQLKPTRRIKTETRHRQVPYVSLVVSLRRDGRKFPRVVSRLVLENFVGPCPPGMECRHLDGDSTNNRLNNLAWGTRLQNASDRIRHGTYAVVDTPPRNPNGTYTTNGKAIASWSRRDPDVPRQ